MTDSKTATELRGKLNKLIIELYHLDFMVDSPASNMTLGEYERERERLLDEFVQAIAATLGSNQPCFATESNYKRCKYSVNRGWCDNAPMLVWDDTGRLFVTLGGLKTWDVTDDAKEWFATLGSGECEIYRVGNTQDVRKCSACGKLMHFNHPLDRDCLNYCPNCGAKVIDTRGENS